MITMSTIRQFLLSFLSLGLLILFGSSLSAWTGPTGTAPNSNAEYPINTSSASQTKAGMLTIATDGGSVVLNDGGVSASSVCLGGACRSVWPTDAAEVLVDSNYCYATRAGRTKSPSCAGGYYLKAAMGYRDSNWDGVGGVCCLAYGSSDPRMTTTVKNTLVSSADALSITFDKTYDQIVSLCLADPSQFKINGGGDTVTCPKTDPL